MTTCWAVSVRTIVDPVVSENVILFASRARGDRQDGSDAGLIVISVEPVGPRQGRRREMARLDDALGGFRVSAVLLVYSQADTN